MKKKKVTWMIYDEMTGKYLRGFTDGGLPMMGAPKAEAMVFYSKEDAIAAFRKLPFTVIAGVVRG